MSLSALSRLLLDFGALGSQGPRDAFREEVLKRVSGVVRFTSAVWASGTMTPGGADFHTITLWRQPPQLLADYERIKHDDPLFMESAQHPGRAVRATARTSLPPTFLPFVSRYRLEQAMSIMYTDPRSLLLTGVSLWRSSPTAPFSDDDAAMLEAAFPHMMDVANRHVLDEVRQPDASPPVTGVAAVDRRGRLHAADARFGAALAREFPRWRGPDLPASLLPAVQADTSRRMVLKRMTLSFTPHGDLVGVRIQARSVVDDLTPRQRQIVELGAGGLTYRQIAERVTLSPTTVRNHLAQAYERLGVRNRVELTRLLHRLR